MSSRWAEFLSSTPDGTRACGPVGSRAASFSEGAGLCDGPRLHLKVRPIHPCTRLLSDLLICPSRLRVRGTPSYACWLSSRCLSSSRLPGAQRRRVTSRCLTPRLLLPFPRRRSRRPPVHMRPPPLRWPVSSRPTNTGHQQTRRSSAKHPSAQAPCGGVTGDARPGASSTEQAATQHGHWTGVWTSKRGARVVGCYSTGRLPVPARTRPRLLLGLDPYTHVVPSPDSRGVLVASVEGAKQTH